MSIIENINFVIVIRIELIIIVAASTLHLVIGFVRKMPDFNTYNLFDSSPFFDFSIKNECNNEENNVFHTWGGWKRKEDDGETYQWVYYDRTNITKINGSRFCYKFISYKDLLNNGQIIKNGTECPKEYNKTCGRIDTLNQELCIKESERCPLYDVGIGEPPDSTNYIYNNDSNVYYNKDNYNITNKTIIGKLILNDGQPCYQSTEKLWKKFDPSETDEAHLNCTNIQIYEKGSDDRFAQKGEITYKKIYEQNLNERSKNIIMKSIPDNETVYLYKRGFYGIDKKCDEKLSLTDNFNSLTKIQSIDKLIQIILGILTASCCGFFIIFEIISCCEDLRLSLKVYCSIFIIYIVLVTGSFSYHVFSYIKMVKSDYSYYNCSDSITNEIIKKGNENNKKIIKYNMITTFNDGIIIVGNLIALLIILIWDRINKCKEFNESRNSKKDFNKNFRVEETPYYDISK